MKQCFNSNKEYFLLFILFACVAIFVLLPIISNIYIPNLWDMHNHFVGIAQAKMALAEKQFFLRTAPSGHFSSFRYPFFQFYSPTSYTIAGLIYQWITPAKPFLAFKVTIWMALVIGEIYMYRLAFWLFKSSPIAILCAIVYLTAPYTFILIIDLAAFNEAIALGVIPVVIFYSLHCFYLNKDKALLQTALAWYFLATIHLVTFFYFSIFFSIFIFAITSRSWLQWKNLVRVGVAYAFACLMAMWYLAPVFLYAKNLFISDQLFNMDAYRRYSASLADLFAPWSHFSQGAVSLSDSSVIDKLSQIHPALGLSIIMSVFLCAYLLIRKVSIKKTFYFMMPYLFILFFIVLFAVWSPINFWEYLPSSLNIMQYTWRLLGQTLWIGAILFGWVMCWFFSKGMNLKQFFIVMTLILIISSSGMIVPKLGLRKYEPFDNGYFVFIPSAYLVNYNKAGANAIDQMSLSALILTISHFNLLNLGETVSIPSIILKEAYALNLTLEGTVFEKKKTKNSLIFLVNKTPLASYALNSGLFKWVIPLDASKIKGDATLMQFKLNNAEKNIILNIKTIYLSGFLNPKSTLSVNQLPPSACYQKMGETICNINVPYGINLLELPVFYYRDMLNITVNAKPVNYESVLFGQYLLTGIKPASGVMNTIHIQFRGLLWANYISYFGWTLFLLLSVFLTLRKKSSTKGKIDIEAI